MITLATILRKVKKFFSELSQVYGLVVLNKVLLTISHPNHVTQNGVSLDGIKKSAHCKFNHITVNFEKTQQYCFYSVVVDHNKTESK